MNPRFLTKDDFFSIEDCNCGKPVFRYHNTSKNMFVMKCGYSEQEYDIKTKKWITSKKQPCKMFYAYCGERPVFTEIKKIIDNKINIPETTLEERLKLLFSFLYVSNRTSTLSEIDILVITRLKREPRKIFYFPTTTLFMKESHRESFKEYETRIFSEKIIDRELYLTQPVVKKQQRSKQFPKQIEKFNNSISNNFIIVSDDDSDRESSETNDESGDEFDSNRELSDYSDAETSSKQEILSENEEFFEETFEETFEESDYNSDY